MVGPGGRERVWRLTRNWSSNCLGIAGAKVETIFETPLPEGPVIFVANHQGNYDICAMFVGLGRRFVFAAKKSVFRYPFLGWHISAAGYIPVDRGNREAAIRSLDEAGEKVRAGTSVAFYAEGTRSWDGSILPFKKGPFMFALKAGVPIIPVALEGSLQVNPKRTWYVCPNTIRILVGPPIPTAGLTEKDRDDLIRRVRGEVIRLHRRLGGLGGDEKNHIAAAGFEGIGRAAEEEQA
jgi:1-acyl-sn-glycerol-3-phosphate acyltransferase